MRRPKYILSGIPVCEECGSRFTLVDKAYGCAAHKRGTCHVKMRVDRPALESSLLQSMGTHLGQCVVDGLLKRFRDALTEKHNAWARGAESLKRQLRATERKIELFWALSSRA